ncbi:hypothetical protein ACIA8O_11150 [Kitasatospora sp. NPDC051853]|uniref:hypothetical protein n=1 Tax=Kitasatospora sp. NPDC051853 TaxID=3364058 RepID=UPI00379E6636
MSEKPSDTDRLESPTEQLLRAALAARAEQVTAQNLRPAARPIRRMRRIRPFHVVTTIAMFGLAASLAIGLLNTGGHPVAQDVAPAVTASESPSPSPSPTPTASPSAELSPSGSASAPATETEAPPATTTAEFRKVKVEVPAGWTVDDRDKIRLCLRTPGTPATAQCLPNGVMITAWEPGEEQYWPSEGFLDSDGGWFNQPNCFLADNPKALPGNGYGLIGTPERSVVKIGSRYANKVRWQVACDTTKRFTAQGWSFHKEQVVVNANGLPAEYQEDLEAIVAGLDLSGRKDPGHGTDVKVTFGTSTVTQEGDVRMVAFPVTWSNVSSTTYATIEPVVAGKEGADPVDAAAVAKQPVGTLERKDGTQWKQLPMLRIGGGMDYAMSGQDAAFPLAPGKSRTITYRLKLTNVGQLGGFKMVGEAYLPTAAGQFTPVGKVEDIVSMAKR